MSKQSDIMPEEKTIEEEFAQLLQDAEQIHNEYDTALRSMTALQKRIQTGIPVTYHKKKQDLGDVLESAKKNRGKKSLGSALKESLQETMLAK